MPSEGSATAGFAVFQSAAKDRRDPQAATAFVITLVGRTLAVARIHRRLIGTRKKDEG